MAFKVSRHVSVRPSQAEYFMTKLPDGLNRHARSPSRIAETSSTD
jgi:hypothetical protein